MTSFKNKNLFHKTLLASTAISLCFSMEAYAGKKEQQAALEKLAREAAEKNAAASRALQQRVNAVMVPQRAAEVTREVLQSAPIVQVRAVTLARELGSGAAAGSGVTRDQAEEARELMSLAHAPSVQQVQQAVEQRILHDVEAQSGSFSRVSDVHSAFGSHALATPNIVASVLVRPEVLDARAAFLEEIAASQVREQGQLPSDTVQEMVSLAKLVPHRVAEVTSAVAQSMIERDVVDVAEVLGSSTAASDAAMVEQELRRRWEEKEVVERRVQALGEKAEHELETQGHLSQRRAEQLAAIGRTGGAELDASLARVAEKVAEKMAERGVDPDDLFAHAGDVEDAAVHYFKQRVEEARKGDEEVQQERLARFIDGGEHQRAFNIYYALPASAEKDNLGNRLVARFFREDVDIDDLGHAAGADPDGAIHAAVEDLAHRFVDYTADVRARIDTLRDDIDAADEEAALDGLYERVFDAYDTVSADMFEGEVQEHVLAALQRSKVFPREDTFIGIVARFADQPYVETARRVMYDLFGAYQVRLDAQIRDMRAAFAADDDIDAVFATLSELQDMMEEAARNQVVEDDILPRLYGLGEDPRAMGIVAAAVAAGGDTAELRALGIQVGHQYGAYVDHIVTDVLPEAVTRGYDKETALHLVRVSQMVDGGVYNPLLQTFGDSYFPALNRADEAPHARLFQEADEFEAADPLHAVAQVFDADMLRLYTAFHGATQAQVGALRAQVQAAPFSQADFVAYRALQARAPEAQLDDILKDAFAWSYNNLLPLTYFMDLYVDADYDEEDRPTAAQGLEEISVGWKAYVKETVEATHQRFPRLAAIDQAAFADLMKFEHYASGEVQGIPRENLDNAIRYLRWITFTKNFKAGVAAGAGTYAGLAVPFNGTGLQATAVALGGELDAAYNAKWAEMDRQIQAVNGLIRGHNAQLADPRVFAFAFEFREWMDDAPYQAFIDSYVDELHTQGVAVNFGQMAQVYMDGRQYNDVIQQAVRDLAHKLTERQTLLRDLVQRVGDLTAAVQARPFGDQEFNELLTLQPLARAADITAIVQAISDKLYADGELDGLAYFNQFLPRFDTAAGQALIAHLGAEHDRLTNALPMRAVRDAVAATDFDLAVGAYDATMVQIVGFMADPVSTPTQTGRIKDLLFRKMFKAETMNPIRPGEVNRLDALFAQFNGTTLQASALAVLGELKREYTAFYQQKYREIDDFLDNSIFTRDYDPLNSLVRYANEYAHLLGPDMKDYVTSQNWLRKTYNIGVNGGINYFQDLAGDLDGVLQARVMPVAVVLDAEFDAYVQGLQLRIQGLNAVLGVVVHGGQKFTDRQFKDMFEIWSSLRKLDKETLMTTLFARLHGDRVNPKHLYPNRALQAQYPGDPAGSPRQEAQDAATRFRDQLQRDYGKYRTTH